jgi:hypothetical protein
MGSLIIFLSRQHPTMRYQPNCFVTIRYDLAYALCVIPTGFWFCDHFSWLPIFCPYRTQLIHDNLSKSIISSRRLTLPRSQVPIFAEQIIENLRLPRLVGGVFRSAKICGKMPLNPRTLLHRFLNLSDCARKLIHVFFASQHRML